MKTYVIILSGKFPQGHRSAGKETFFEAQYKNAQVCEKCHKATQAMCAYECFEKRKIHTIRKDYDLWKERADEVNRGEAIISVRKWSGRPYNSKQVEIGRLTAEDGVCVQRLRFSEFPRENSVSVDGKTVPLLTIAKNDGLSKPDWVEWFLDCSKWVDYAVIHFTKFRYQ